MKLNTLSCKKEGCINEFTGEDISMWEVLYQARQAGWLLNTADIAEAWCPEHNPIAHADQEWAVGCYTCGWEDDDEPILSKKEAQSVAFEHECEADTWIMSPEQLAKKRVDIEAYQARRSAERAAEQLQAEEATKAALELQKEIESWASNWLRIRNFLLPWRKRHIREE
jgi:hypothetical protein